MTPSPPFSLGRWTGAAGAHILHSQWQKVLCWMLNASDGTARSGRAIPKGASFQSTPVRVGLVIGLLMGACAGPAPKPTGPAETTADTSEYVIGAGDKLSVFVYENPQLSVASLPVRPDGRISIPLVPDVVAAGRTPTQLSAVLAEQLKVYIRDPNVTVMVLDFLGPFNRQVRVIGEAAVPQAIAYRAHMTVLDVMIEAKGLTRFAAGNSAVIVRRQSNGDLVRIPVRLSDLLKDGDISQNVELQPGDTLVIPQTWF